LYVLHDADDGGWQLLTGKSHTEKVREWLPSGRFGTPDPTVGSLPICH